MAVIVDSTIYIKGALTHFTYTGYKYNVNHPVIHQLYTQYKEWRGLPSAMPISDKERRSFELNVDKMIAEGRIKVK